MKAVRMLSQLIGTYIAYWRPTHDSVNVGYGECTLHNKHWRHTERTIYTVQIHGR